VAIIIIHLCKIAYSVSHFLFPVKGWLDKRRKKKIIVLNIIVLNAQSFCLKNTTKLNCYFCRDRKI